MSDQRLFYKGQFGFKIIPTALPTRDGLNILGWVALRPDYSGESNHRALRRWGKR